METNKHNSYEKGDNKTKKVCDITLKILIDCHIESCQQFYSFDSILCLSVIRTVKNNTMFTSQEFTPLKYGMLIFLCILARNQENNL
jgi:hypothetical protein